jgi:predicted ATPase
MPFREHSFPTVKHRFFLLTGAFGSGKSTLLELLQLRGIWGIVEPARQILAEQRSIRGNGVPEKDLRLFIELMLSRMLDAYRQSGRLLGPILFDGEYQIFWAMPHFSALTFLTVRMPLSSIGTTLKYSWLRRGSRYIARMTSARCRFPRCANLATTFEQFISDWAIP